MQKMDVHADGSGGAMLCYLDFDIC